MNLATHLLFDAFKNKYDTAVVISNDSDLAESIRLSGSIGKKIGVLNPHKERPSRKLLSVCPFFKPIRKNVLKESLFPTNMEDVNGKFHKPDRW